MFSKRDVLLVLLSVSLVAVVMAYIKPYPLFDCSQTLSELAILNEILGNSRGVPTNFDHVSQRKLAWLLKGVYLSELVSFKCEAQSFELSLSSIPQGHAGVHNDVLFVFLRRSKTLSDFAHDALVYRREHTSGGRVYAGPARLAEEVKLRVASLLEEHKINHLVITGVSLGGAIGTLVAEAFAEKLDVSLILFNSFQIGDQVFRQAAEEKISRIFHIKNISDTYSCPIDARIGTPLYFDKRANTKSDHHCKIASLLRALGSGEQINEMSFYFSDECRTDTEDEKAQEQTEEEEEHMSPLTL